MVKVRGNDPVETIIYDALESANIDFVTENDDMCKRLDFYIPSLDTYIECKAYFSNRTENQLASHDNVILIQGRQSAITFSKLIAHQF